MEGEQQWGERESRESHATTKEGSQSKLAGPQLLS